MKWLRNLMVSLAFLAFCISRVKTATREELATIFLRLYTGSHIDEYIDAHVEEAETLIHDMDIRKRTVIYIHGFTESINSTSVYTIVNAYLSRNDHNILAVDWSVIAGMNYVQVSKNVESVGTSIAMAVNDMVYAGLPSQYIHVVGHSMGAHVSAYVGRNVDFSLQRITGLDPAGPFFNFLGRHLTQTDARFVDIIHTDSGFYGIARVTGSVDFFPNGGRRVQPGCPLRYAPYSNDDFCSHHRSWIFYSESLTSKAAFLAVQCSDDKQSLVTKLRAYDTIIMGYATPTTAKGSYCLVTSPSAPHGLGIEGAHEA